MNWVLESRNPSNWIHNQIDKRWAAAAAVFVKQKALYLRQQFGPIYCILESSRLGNKVFVLRQKG